MKNFIKFLQMSRFANTEVSSLQRASISNGGCMAGGCAAGAPGVLESRMGQGATWSDEGPAPVPLVAPRRGSGEMMPLGTSIQPVGPPIVSVTSVKCGSILGTYPPGTLPSTINTYTGYATLLGGAGALYYGATRGFGVGTWFSLGAQIVIFYMYHENCWGYVNGLSFWSSLIVSAVGAFYGFSTSAGSYMSQGGLIY